MYHPSRGGVRGGRDQFSWDDVKADKHRENYLGHSIKAPVGRWQKGKDLHWYARDKKSEALNMEAAKEEIRRIKEEEEQAMREALGLAPKRVSRPQGNRLDKHEYAELVKRGSAAEDLGGGHAEAAQVQGLGLYKVPQNQEESSMVHDKTTETDDEDLPKSTISGSIDVPEEETSTKKRRHEEKRDQREKKHDRRDKKRSNDSDDKKKHRFRDSDDKKKHHDLDDKKKHRRDREKRRHDSD